MPKNTTTHTVADLSTDLFWGTRDIGREIGRSERQAFHMLASGILPGAKIGGHWVASRPKLHAHIAALIDAAA
jgi:hypothetical protein